MHPAFRTLRLTHMSQTDQINEINQINQIDEICQMWRPDPFLSSKNPFLPLPQG